MNKRQANEIEGLVCRLLKSIGENPNREGLSETPQRFAEMIESLTAGYRADPKELVAGAVFPIEHDQMIVVKDISFYSLCVHGKSRVYTPQGALFAKDVRPGKLLFTLDPTSKELKLTEVLAVSRTKHRERYHLSFEGGYQIWATSEHPVFVLGRGFVPIRAVQPGDKLLGIHPPEPQAQLLQAALQQVRTRIYRVASVERQRATLKSFTMYNFECAPYNSYLVNGILAHNCEHHILPFFGKAHVGYIPQGHVIGMSKIPQIVEHFSKRLQLQERLSEEIADFLMEALKPKGVGVVVEGFHLCMAMRELQKDAWLMTSAVKGIFRRDPRTRGEFFQLIGKRM